MHELWTGLKVEWMSYYHLPDSKQIMMSWSVPTYPGTTESAQRFGLRYLVPKYTTDHNANDTLDKAEWWWTFDEQSADGQRNVVAKLFTDGMIAIPIVAKVNIENGDKPRAHMRARIECVLQALKKEEMENGTKH